MHITSWLSCYIVGRRGSTSAISTLCVIQYVDNQRRKFAFVEFCQLLSTLAYKRDNQTFL